MAVAFVPLAWFFQYTSESLRKTNDGLIHAIARVREQNAITNEMVDSIAGLAQAMDVKQVFMVGMIERILVDIRASEEMRTSFKQIIQEFDFEKDRHFNDLLVFCMDKKIRLSALQQLSQTFGTLSSLRKMELSATQEGVDQALTQSYINALRKELEKRLK